MNQQTNNVDQRNKNKNNKGERHERDYNGSVQQKEVFLPFFKCLIIRDCEDGIVKAFSDFCFKVKSFEKINCHCNDSFESCGEEIKECNVTFKIVSFHNQTGILSASYLFNTKSCLITVKHASFTSEKIALVEDGYQFFDALNNDNVELISLCDDIYFDSAITLTLSNIAIDGGGHSIYTNSQYNKTNSITASYVTISNLSFVNSYQYNSINNNEKGKGKGNKNNKENSLVLLTNSSYVTFNNVSFYNSNSNNLSILKSNNITLNNLTSNGAREAGLLIEQSDVVINGVTTCKNRFGIRVSNDRKQNETSVYINQPISNFFSTFELYLQNQPIILTDLALVIDSGNKNNKNDDKNNNSRGPVVNVDENYELIIPVSNKYPAFYRLKNQNW